MRNEEDNKLYPNCFAYRIDKEEKENNINIVFGEAKINEDGDIKKKMDVSIVSDINVNKDGLKVIIKSLLDLAEEYNKIYNTDILGEIVEDFEEAGEENATS